MDPSLNKYYSEGNEQHRLSTHQLERDRTLHLLKKYLPSPPATILDVGGANGAYAFPLSQQGYTVHLIDPVALHVEQAKSNPLKLASITQGDARDLPVPSSSADIILLFGPLYHLPQLPDRQQALAEAYRVLKPKGLLLAVGISRFASLMDALNKNTLSAKLPQLKRDLSTGIHRKTAPDHFVFGYFHHPQELKEEIQNAGFSQTSLHAIEGPVWAASLIQPLYQDKIHWPALIALLDELETDESTIGASAHILAISRKNG